MFSIFKIFKLGGRRRKVFSKSRAKGLFKNKGRVGKRSSSFEGRKKLK